MGSNPLPFSREATPQATVPWKPLINISFVFVAFPVSQKEESFGPKTSSEEVNRVTATYKFNNNKRLFFLYLFLFFLSSLYLSTQNPKTSHNDSKGFKNKNVRLLFIPFPLYSLNQELTSSFLSCLLAAVWLMLIRSCSWGRFVCTTTSSAVTGSKPIQIWNFSVLERKKTVNFTATIPTRLSWILIQSNCPVLN